MLSRREICSQLLQWLVAGGFFHLTWKYTQGINPPFLEVSFDESPLEGDVLFIHSVYLVGLKQGIKAMVKNYITL